MNNQLTHLSLFSGIGGLDLAAEWAGFKTIGQCEWADYPAKILEKYWPDVPKWRDVRDVSGESVRERTGVDCITVVSGGFPCQPHSLAGKRLASHDERDLWGELLRVFCETDARWLVGENVPGLLTSENGRFFGQILKDLAKIGCDAWWYCFPAYACGAKYIGERVCIVATSNCERWRIVGENKKMRPDEQYKKMLGEWEARQNNLLPYPKRIKPQSSSRLERNDDGISKGMDRLKAYGNSVNPYQFYPVFRAIKEMEEMLCDFSN